jgi:hypothetical protein
MALFNNSMHIIYQNNRNMFVASALSGDLATENDITNPTQQDLATNTESQWYVQINQSQNNGQPVGQAPMYYAVQQGPGLTITIHYIFLYAYQGGQTFELGGTAGYMWDLGMHQGDLEIFSNQLRESTPRGTYTFVPARYEAHG